MKAYQYSRHAVSLQGDALVCPMSVSCQGCSLPCLESCTCSGSESVPRRLFVVQLPREWKEVNRPTMLNPHDFSTTYTELTTLLAIEEGAGSPTGVADLEAHFRRRATLDQFLQRLEDALSQVRRGVEHLPRLPRMEHLRWAQAVLAFPTLPSLEVDTDGLPTAAYTLHITPLP